MIRPAEARDIARVWSLIKELAEYERLSDAVTGSEEALAKDVLERKLCTVFVYEEEGEVVGYTLSFPTYSTFRTLPGVWLEDLYVTPKCRGKGYGKALLQNLIQTCEAEKLGRLEWSVLSWNEPAVQFYLAMGATVMPDWRICRISFE